MVGKTRASRGEKKPTEELPLQKTDLGQASGIMTGRLRDGAKREA